MNESRANDESRRPDDAKCRHPKSKRTDGTRAGSMGSAATEECACGAWRFKSLRKPNMQEFRYTPESKLGGPLTETLEQRNDG